jgi:hypothetical protein
MNLNVESRAVPEARSRYLLLDQILRRNWRRVRRAGGVDPGGRIRIRVKTKVNRR